jgi:thiol-disulfide isomerase/thioredoxin
MPPIPKEVPQARYRDAVVLYYWTGCGFCRTFAPTFELFVQMLPSHVQVFQIDVFKHRERLAALGVTLDKGVPRLEFYDGHGTRLVYVGPRTLDAMAAALVQHLQSHPKPRTPKAKLEGGSAEFAAIDSIAVSPAKIRPPALVLYFSHGCGHCRDFAPTFAQLIGHDATKRIQVVAIDVSTHQGALRSLQPQAQSGGVPHVVAHPASGPQVVFDGERTLPDLLTFVQRALPAKPPKVKGGATIQFTEKPEKTHIRKALSQALDDLQDKVEAVLGAENRELFEKKHSSVCYVGWQCKDTPDKDRLYVMIVPRLKRTASTEASVADFPIFATIHGSRTGKLTPKIHTNADPVALLRRKLSEGFVKARETDVLPQALRDMGYTVRVDAGARVLHLD